ncbi:MULTISPECIES: ORF6C domain-containing protein, partial [Enterococcus]
SAVGKKAWDLAKEYFDHKVSDDLFLAKVGHFRGIIYKRLKETFNVPRYYDIRRIDFTRAKQVIEIVSLSNLKDYQLRLTARQKEIAYLNADDVEGLEIA